MYLKGKKENERDRRCYIIESNIQNPGFKSQDPRLTKIQHTKSKFQKSKIKDWQTSNIQNESKIYISCYHSAQVHTLQTKLLFLSRIMVSKAFCQMLWKPWSSGPWFSGVANLRSDSRSRYPTCTDSPLPFQGKRLQRGNATTKINWVWVGGKEIQSTQHLVLILLHVRFTHKRFTQLSFSQDRLIFNHNIN